MALAARTLAVPVLVAALAGAGARAQEVPSPPFLIINQEQILTGSEAGRRLLDEEERARDALRAEARALDAAFEEEERRLTEQRPELDPAEFRRLSDAFDARVVQARRDQDTRSATLAQEFDQRRRQFYARVAPILVMLMDRYGAKAILDENSVLLADQSLNITAAVIAEIDAQPAGEAPAAEPAPEGPAEPAREPAETPAGERDGGE
jgi:Skp family chaperone for outer membrane proteins